MVRVGLSSTPTYSIYERDQLKASWIIAPKITMLIFLSSNVYILARAGSQCSHKNGSTSHNMLKADQRKAKSSALRFAAERHRRKIKKRNLLRTVSFL